MKTVMKRNIIPDTAVTDSTFLNFGGFVPLSTVDWRGRSVCVIFFRGCPVRCWYCHNAGIQDGTDKRPISEIIGMIRSASLLISGVIFSGGEATMQPEALIQLCRAVKAMGLKCGLHTNGVFPDVIRSLISLHLVEFIALDMKPEWNLNTVKGKERALGTEVLQSLSLCTDAFHNGDLPGFQVVLTLFPGSGEQIESVMPFISPDVDLILQQGVYTGIRSLKPEDLKNIADSMHRPVRIRTRETGEIVYEGTGNRGDAGIRQG